MPTDPTITIIFGDGRTRASAQPDDLDDSLPNVRRLPDFKGMTVAEALRLNCIASQTSPSPGFGFAIEDRGGVISLLDIADAFEELTLQDRKFENVDSDIIAQNALSNLRLQLIQFISNGRIY